MKEIVRISLDNEMDLILAHKRTMKLAEMCGLITSAQTRFATAVSEIARCAITNGEKSHLVLSIDSLAGGKKEIAAAIYDNIDLAACNSDAFSYASRLSKDIVKSHENGIYEVILRLRLPYSGIISPARITAFIDFFKKETSLSPYDELRKKNIQLIELSEKLTDSESKYRQLTDTLPLIVFSVSDNGAVTLSNKSVQEIFGDRFIAFSPASMGNIIHSEDNEAIKKGWESAKKRGKIFTGQARVQINDNYLWHLISIVPNADDAGEISGWTVSMTDINAQKLIEETLKDNHELRQAQESLKASNEELSQKNKELEQFAYIASHDLQEPLRKIRNFTSLAERNLTEEEKDKLYFNKINTSAERMSRLIKDVLNYSKLSTGETEFVGVDLNAVLEEVVNDFEFLIEEKKAEIIIDALPSVQGVPVQLSQLFYNLIGNSLKFVEGNPSIKIAYEYLKDKGLHKISVIDNGIGIDSKYISKIFTIFKRLHHQNEYEGTGIGLALCKKIVQNHNGSIEINSTPGVGTTVDVFLPA